MRETSKKHIASLIEKINKTEDISARKLLCKQLKKYLYLIFDGVDKITYSEDIIRDEYVNFDSNCGLTLVDASIDIAPIADYIKENKIKDTSLENAARIMNAEFGERDEYWNDLINDDYLVSEETVGLLWSLFDDVKGCEDVFKADLAECIRRN